MRSTLVFGLQPSKQRGSVLETVLMMRCSRWVLKPSRSKYILLYYGGDSGDLVEEVAMEFARRKGSAVEICGDGILLLGSYPLYIGTLEVGFANRRSSRLNMPIRC
jgi:hypothetical protein